MDRRSGCDIMEMIFKSQGHFSIATFHLFLFVQLSHRRSFCAEVCQQYDVIYNSSCPTLYSIPNTTSSYLSVIFTFFATRMKMTMVFLYSAVIYLSLEIGTYEKNYRGLNLEDGQFFSITTVRRQFRIRCEHI